MMLFQRCMRPNQFTAIAAKKENVSLCVPKRTHMNHGSDPNMHTPPPSPSGPRSSMSIGYDAAKHTTNILRLLEASHGSYYNASDTLSTVWHGRGQCWKYKRGWKPVSPTEAYEKQSSLKTPSLHSLWFSDDRTALAKLVGSDGIGRYLSILRVDSNPVNDGWVILREIQSKPDKNTSSDYVGLHETLCKYLEIEHGGGEQDAETASNLFAKGSSLVAVGISDPSQTPTEWSAPVGNLLEISRDTYISGVVNQTPHSEAARVHDEVCTVDVLGNAASAVLRVGNGAQSFVFEDHLLLGKEERGWRILSKTFCTQVWPHVH